jgi:hypothetical protein
MELRLDASGCGCPHGKAVKNPSGPCGTTVIFSAYACAVLGIPQALLGMANDLAAALPWRKGPPNGPAGLRVSAMRHGVAGTKLKPVSDALPMNAAEGVLPVPSFSDAIAGIWLVETGVAVGAGLGAGICVAEATGTEVDLDVAGAPPQPAKENKIRDKQMSERIPEAQDESWRRIDYLSAIQGEQLWGVQSWNYNEPAQNVYRFKVRFC